MIMLLIEGAGMRKSDVIDYYGSNRKAAEALGVSVQYVQQWKDRVPMGMAYRIESESEGDMIVNPNDYPNKRDRRKAREI